MRPAAITTNVGDVLCGKYRVERIIGIGGMGMVVEAMHLELDQRVALKFMLPEMLTSTGDATTRFLKEARAAVKLRSEHVCRVLDVGRLENQAPYIVMEYLEGHDFSAVLQHGRLSIVDAVDYILQAAEGVAEAHANNIVHRDLKPSNLFLTTDNDGSSLVKVLDFGISKSHGASSTKTNDVMGSPTYMAPEQMASSKKVDTRADVWALGVIMYQALTGKLPFDGDSLPAVCMSVMNEPAIPISAVRRDLPPPLAEVIMRCLEKHPDNRVPTIAALAAAIAPFGPPGSEASAIRVAKVLRRSMPLVASTSARFQPPPINDLRVETSPTLASPSVEIAPATIPVRVATPIGRDSTFKSSAAEVVTTPPPRRRLGWIAVGALGVMGAALAAVLVMRHDDATGTRFASNTMNVATVPNPPIPTPPIPTPPIVTADVPAPPTPAPTPAPVVEPEPAPIPVLIVKKPEPKAKPKAKPEPKRVEARPVDKPVERLVEAKPEVKPDPPKAEPPPIEVKPAELPHLSRATIDGIAQTRTRELTKCEAGETLKGEVTVRFQVDANGKVTAAQVSSNTGKPKVAGCILVAFRRWSFPKTANGAQGTYTLAYQ